MELEDAFGEWSAQSCCLNRRSVRGSMVATAPSRSRIVQPVLLLNAGLSFSAGTFKAKRSSGGTKLMVYANHAPSGNVVPSSSIKVRSARRSETQRPTLSPSSRGLRK
jgi:hypothetical protein